MPQTIATVLMIVSSFILSMLVTQSSQEIKAQSISILTKATNIVASNSKFLNLD